MSSFKIANPAITFSFCLSSFQFLGFPGLLIRLSQASVVIFSKFPSEIAVDNFSLLSCVNSNITPIAKRSNIKTTSISTELNPFSSILY